MILLPTRVFCSNYKCLRFFRMALISHLFRWVFLSRTAENGNGVTLMYSRRKNGDLAHTDTEDEFFFEGHRERSNVCRR